MFIHTTSHKQLTNVRRINISIMNRRRKTQKIISYYESGHVLLIAWIKNGKHYRPGGAPASIEYFKNGEIQTEEWFKNGKLYRNGGAPAILFYYKTGHIEYEAWYKNGKERRVVTYSENGTVKGKKRY